MRLPTILHDETVSIIRVTNGPPDPDGVPTQTTTPETWKNVNVHQLTSTELTNAGRDTTVTTWRVSGPPVTVDAGDQITWGGTTYQVDGDPDTRTGAHRINHTRLFMVRATG